MKFHTYYDEPNKRYVVRLPLSSNYVSSNYKQVQTWCYETLGNPVTDKRWVDQLHWGEVFIFRKEDLILFLLRWHE